MDELISRRAAIDAINSIQPIITHNKRKIIYRAEAADAIKALPTAQPRPKGKWVPHPSKQFKEFRGTDICTSCGMGTIRRRYDQSPDGIEYKIEYNYCFCPWCGSDNREEQDE